MKRDIMKTIGLLGGMSWESTATYYRLINQEVRRSLGGQNSARLILHSLNFQEIEPLQRAGRWDLLGELLADASRKLEVAGSDMVLVCTNTMHKVADQIQASISIPFVHIVDVVGDCLKAHGHSKVGLLGTRFTMEDPFYRDRLKARYGIDVIVPETTPREKVHKVIYDELCKGEFQEASRDCYLQIIHDLHAQGAQSVILGCTEIGLLVRPSDTRVPLIDTTVVHSARAVALALADAPQVQHPSHASL